MAANAGELATLPVETVEIVAADTGPDWSGFYIGASGAFAPGGTWAFLDNGAEFNNGILGNGQAYGGFAGYNFVRGNLVFGGEVAYFGPRIEFTESSSIFFENLIDVKGRVGYTFNNVMVYGTAGMALGTLNDFNTFYFDLTGFSYGAGVELLIRDRFVVGAEYLVRDMNGTDPTRANITGEFSLGTVQVRAGMKF